MRMILISLCKKKLGSNLKSFLSFAKKEVTGITTGISMLDKQLLGLRGLVGILGEPKSCKSTLLLQIAAYNARRGNPVYIIDRENGLTRITQRLLCQTYGRSWHSIRNLKEDQIVKMLDKLSEWPIYVDVDNVTFSEVQSVVDTLVEAYEDKHVILMIDSLHAMPQNHENIRSSVDEWLVNLDSLKLKHDRKLTIIMTIEKNRGSYGIAVKGGGKESGRIEYKLEQGLDMRYDEKAQLVIIECTLNRDGPSNVGTKLEQVMEDPSHPASFTFKLQEVTDLI